MKAVDSFYKENSYGSYYLVAQDNNDLSHFGWEVPLEIEDANAYNYCVHWRGDFDNDKDFREAFDSFRDE